MKTRFSACQTPRSMYPSIFNSFRVIRCLRQCVSPKIAAVRCGANDVSGAVRCNRDSVHWCRKAKRTLYEKKPVLYGFCPHRYHQHYQMACSAASVAVSTSLCHLQRPCARCHAQWRPMLHKPKSISTVQSQVRLCRPVRFGDATRPAKGAIDNCTASVFAIVIANCLLFWWNRCIFN